MAKHELEHVELTNMCMIQNPETREVLVQVRKKNDWDGISFPGGHVKMGEAFVPAVIREVEEETGLTIKHVIPCGQKDWYDYKKQMRYVVLFYKTTEYEGNLLPSSPEGENVWMSLEEIMNSSVAPDFLEMLDIFLSKNQWTEFFYEDTQNPDEEKRWVKRFY